MKHVDRVPRHDCCGGHFPGTGASFPHRETHGGQFTVLVSSPTPMAGAIYILQTERVHPVGVPLPKAVICVTKWGAGAAEMRAVIRSGSK